MIRALIALVAISVPVSASAVELTLPATARLTAERDTDPDVYVAPMGVFAEGAVPVMSVEGAVRRAAWRLDSPGLTPLQVMRPLRSQLQKAGFEVVLDCASPTCGGFDFRFATETLPGPNMYVNIRAYHFVTAVRPGDAARREVVTVLTSTSATSAYVQIVRATESDTGTVAVTDTADVPVIPEPVPAGDITGALLSQGHVVLDGLEFDTGSSDLGSGSFASLDQLGAFLNARPDLRVALVGHTDSIGGLDGNIALSKRRAQSVRQRLIQAHGVDGTRIEAEGMGYLAPVASNLASEGREANRRVEVVVLSED